MESEATQDELIAPVGASSSIDIRIPSDPRFIRPVRLATGGLAALGGFDVEMIDDLRIAVDELCAALLEVGAGDSLNLRLSLDESGLHIEGTTRAGTDPVDEERFALSRQILSVISDDFGFDVVDGIARCWMVRSSG